MIAIKLLFIVGVFFISFTYHCLATRVQKCSSPGVVISDDTNTVDNQVFISGCDEPPCKFTRNSTVEMEVYFTPAYDVNRLTTSVYAWVFSIPIPYLGVDGLTACNNLFTSPKKVKTSCPVRQGQPYYYKNSLEIKATYPKVKGTLHWALLDAKNNANIYCFEVPIKITT